MQTHNLFFKHACISNGKKCLFAYGNGYAYKFDSNFSYIQQEPVSFQFTSTIANGFPVVKLKQEFFGIALNSKSLFKFDCFEIEKVAEAPQVYTFGYCLFGCQIIAFDYFANQFFVFDGVKFNLFKISFNEKDCQLFNYSDQVFVFSRHSQFCCVVSRGKREVLHQLGYIGQVVFHSGNIIYTDQQIMVDLEYLKTYKTFSFIRQVHFGFYFNEIIYKNDGVKFIDIFQNQNIQMDLKTLNSKLLVFEEVASKIETKQVHFFNDELNPKQYMEFEDGELECMKRQVEKEDKIRHKDSVVQQILFESQKKKIQTKNETDQILQLTEYMELKFDQIMNKLEQIDKRVLKLEQIQEKNK
ncbi:Conserved_hypothetical protein [Hexamita inflata]|uniref:Uncharacterized protein n=1 Tax=Hexamita inflata TaxID=28002 RepID=A0AA86UL72_9EUKA|nr:Conserved hypothetical protein [Hexamita inflata]